MRQALVALIAIGGAAPAAAVDITLSYEAVMHVRDIHSIEVLDRPGHRMGVSKFRGLAIFPEDDVIVHRYEGWFDLVDGSGPFQGYALWTFDDGSTLGASYDGKALEKDPDDTEVDATFHTFEGSGRFEGVAGTGMFAGRRVDALEEGGATHVIGTLELSLPD